MTALFNKLKQRWGGISTNFQIVLILAVFALAGSSVLVVEAFIFRFIGLTRPESFFSKSAGFCVKHFPASSSATAFLRHFTGGAVSFFLEF